MTLERSVIMGKYGSGTVYLRGRIWHIQYYVRGKKLTESSNSEMKRDAVQLLQRRLARNHAKPVQSSDFESGASASSATPARILLRVFGLLRWPRIPRFAHIAQLNRYKTATAGGIAMSVRQSFVEHFGEDQARALEQAADGHANEPNSTNRGSDPFRWAVTICIGYQCCEVDGYREGHGITAPWPEIKRWIKEHADLEHHDGDVDYLALFCGTYNEYVRQEV